MARPRRCLTLSNPVPWENWMAAYIGYTLRMKTLFRGWPVMVHDTHTRRKEDQWHCSSHQLTCWRYVIILIIGGGGISRHDSLWLGTSSRLDCPTLDDRPSIARKTTTTAFEGPFVCGLCHQRRLLRCHNHCAPPPICPWSACRWSSSTVRSHDWQPTNCCRRRHQRD